MIYVELQIGPVTHHTFAIEANHAPAAFIFEGKRYEPEEEELLENGDKVWYYGRANRDENTPSHEHHS